METYKIILLYKALFEVVLTILITNVLKLNEEQDDQEEKACFQGEMKMSFTE